MADAKQHPLVADGKVIAAGNVFLDDDVMRFVLQKIPNIGPVPEILRFYEGWGSSAGEGVVRGDPETFL